MLYAHVSIGIYFNFHILFNAVIYRDILDLWVIKATKVTTAWMGRVGNKGNPEIPDLPA